MERVAALRLVVAVVVAVVLRLVLAMLQMVAVMETLIVVLKVLTHYSIRMALERVAALHLVVAAAVVVVLMPVLAMLQEVALLATVLRTYQSVVLVLESAIWLLVYPGRLAERLAAGFAEIQMAWVHLVVDDLV